MMPKQLRCGAASLALAALVTTTSCLDMEASDTAICVLIDISGTYADEKDEVVKIIKREVIPTLIPGDTMITILIDSESYEMDNVKTITTLDARPSRANAQKLALSHDLERFAKGAARSRYTDIPGAMMLAAEYLKETGSRTQVMLLFSDMREELPAGVKRELRPDEFVGIHMVAMNVKRLGSDAANPKAFRARLADWEKRVQGAGSEGWQIVMDPTKLTGVLAELRS